MNRPEKVIYTAKVHTILRLLTGGDGQDRAGPATSDTALRMACSNTSGGSAPVIRYRSLTITAGTLLIPARCHFSSASRTSSV